MDMAEPFVIAGQTIAPGTQADVSFTITTMANGASSSLAVRVLHGARPGPAVFVSAAIHGDEVVGVEVIRQVLAPLDPKTFRGTLVAVPIVNVLGFMGYDGQSFDSYVFQGAIDASIAIACINSFAAKLTRPTTLVIDNAPIHTSREFQLMIPEWERQNLCLWFLPPYSPELNLIEILWKKIKYHWLPLEAYESFEKLKEMLADVLANIGKEFKIRFQ